MRRVSILVIAALMVCVAGLGGCSLWPWSKKEEKPPPAHTFSRTKPSGPEPARGPEPTFPPR